jgi:hypothetical protein
MVSVLGDLRGPRFPDVSLEEIAGFVGDLGRLELQPHLKPSFLPWRLDFFRGHSPRKIGRPYGPMPGDLNQTTNPSRGFGAPSDWRGQWSLGSPIDTRGVVR